MRVAEFSVRSIMLLKFWEGCVLRLEDEIHKNTSLIIGCILLLVASYEAQDLYTYETSCSTLPVDIIACIKEKKCSGPF
jgi:hypothetical protein